MEKYAYDLECLRNIFTATFVNIENEEKYVFYIGLGKNNYDDLYTFLQQKMILVGYNNHSYDDPLLRVVMDYKGENINNQLYQTSSKLVDDYYRSDKEVLGLRYPKKGKYPWRSIDLMKILAFDKLGISLKQTAINLKWHRIQDMPIHHTDNIKDNQLDIILDYNLNDVLITKRLYEEITPIRELRTELSKLYNVDLTSASDSKMANLILENIYSTELNTDISSIKDMRTVRDRVLLGDCIPSFISFKTPELVELLERIQTTIVYNYNRYKYSENLYFANCQFNLGIGGLHTDDAPGVFVTDDNYLIQDMDVASYYPNLIINNNFAPKHLGKNFIDVLKKITSERLSAKKSGDKVKADGLKITINSIFGKLGSDTFWLQDAKQMLSTTVTGQLGLLMLVEELFLSGISIISCNTDGVVCKIPKSLENKYYEIAKNWEKVTNLELEYTQYKKYVRRDVNSYITQKADGKTKEKGAFLKEVDLKKSYHMPIVAKALYAYFIQGVPVRQTLDDCKDIMEFCISQKSGGNFGIELHKNSGIQKLQKTNRFFISKKGGSLIKREGMTNKRIGLYVGKQVEILNDYDNTIPFENYAVDLSFYEKEVMKIVDEIEPKQFMLFDMNDLGKSSKTKMEVSSSTQVREEKIDFSIKELNKLGKNQFIKKIESMANNNQKIENINPRYVYVLDFNYKAMTASVYCLAKAVVQQISIDKKAYAKASLQIGQLVFCTKFEKAKTGHCLVDYKISDKIEFDEKELM